MLRKFNPWYDLPSRSHFSHVAILALYSETCEKLEALLRSDEVEYYSSTADFWSSDATEPHLGYTIHYLNKQMWELQSACLQLYYTPEDHTDINLKQALAHTIEKWHLNANNVVVLTTDNATNICLACESFEWRHLSCFGHNLDLAVQNGLADHGIERILCACMQTSCCCLFLWLEKKKTVVGRTRKERFTKAQAESRC